MTEQTSTRRLRILKYRGSLHGTNDGCHGVTKEQVERVTMQIAKLDDVTRGPEAVAHERLFVDGNEEIQRRRAEQLGIDHHVFNFGDRFRSEVVEPYVAAVAEVVLVADPLGDLASAGAGVQRGAAQLLCLFDQGHPFG